MIQSNWTTDSCCTQNLSDVDRNNKLAINQNWMLNFLITSTRIQNETDNWISETNGTKLVRIILSCDNEKCANEKP